MTNKIIPIIKLSYPFVLFILAFSLLCSLSVWQCSRGLEKQKLASLRLDNTQQAVLTHADLMSIAQHPNQYTYRNIKLEGSFENHHILLDNKIHNGQVGYEVITPFVINSTQSATQSVLINRGWIPRGDSRTQLPHIEPILINHPIIIKGHIASLTKNRLIKNTLESNQLSPAPNSSENSSLNNPLRIQEIDFSLLQPFFNHTFSPFIINLTGESVFSFETADEALSEKKTEPKTWLSPQKHFAYALQWLLLAFSLAIIYTRVYRQK